MTDEEIRQLGPAFAAYLRRYRPCFLQDRTADHFDDYSRALLSDLERKSVEPIALARGTAVRTLQAFLAVARWGHDAVRDTLQRHVASLLPDLPGDRLGTVGIIDETSCRKRHPDARRAAAALRGAGPGRPARRGRPARAPRARHRGRGYRSAGAPHGQGSASPRGR